jgi:hypothetical protein
MCDPVTKRDVLNDFDLARLRLPNQEPSPKDYPGTLPLLALDLLSETAFKGQVKHFYRHDSESFAWCFVYICVCMNKDEDLVGTITPHFCCHRGLRT